MIDTRPAPSEPYERTDARALTTDLVIAQIVQNVLGGVGAGLALATALWLAGADLGLAWRWPVGVAGLVAGASTTWRAYLDEWRADRRWHRRELEHRGEMEILTELCDGLEAERDDARNKLQSTAAENNRLKNEIFSMRAQMDQVRHEANPKRGGPTLWWKDEDRRDARALLKLWYETKKWPGELTMQWSRKRQENARDLLQAAEIAPVVVYNGLAPEQDYEWAEARLLAYFAKETTT